MTLPLNQREHDLVRYHRMELFVAGLITRDEYDLLATERGAVDRLGDYDTMRARIVELEEQLEEARHSALERSERE